MSKAHVVVGVTGTESASAALEFAAAEARRRGCGVHVVHVMHPTWAWANPRDAVDLAFMDSRLREAGSALVHGCEERLRSLVGDEVPVSGELVQGTVVDGLSSVASSALMIVLVKHTPGRLVRTMSVTNGVAGRVEVPVVAVPDGWRERGHDDRPVLVGVESGTESAGVVAVALEEAARRETRALMVHAWMYSEAFDREVFAGEFGKQEHLRIAATLTRELAPVTGADPEGQASLTVEHGRAAEVLVAQAQGAQLLVVGRHHPRFRLGSHLGPVTRAVLGHAPCPVMVVPVTPDRPDVDQPARAGRG